MASPGLRWGVGVAVAVAAADQASKWAVVGWLEALGRHVPVTGFFDVVLVHNRGASFGLFQTDSPWGPWLLSAFTVAVIAGLLVWMARADEPALTLALGLIVGGALGNVIDRIALGHVIDFLDFHIGAYHWPAFNLADSAITVGAAIVLYGALIGGRGGRTVSGKGEE